VGGRRGLRVVAGGAAPQARAAAAQPVAADPSAAPIPTLRELRAAIPKECFEPDTSASLGYAAADLAALVACFSCGPWVTEHMWALPPYAAVTGLAMWCNFVVGHDCGHGSFSKSKWLNALVGHVTHSPLLVPFWPWAYSHKQHHRFHNHRTKDMSHPWFDKEEYAGVSPVVRALALDHPWGLFLGFPGYLLLEPEWSGTDGCHFNPQSRLFERAPPGERARCAVSTAACAGFLALSLHAAGGFGNWCVEYLAPYLVFSWWLFTVTYLQHHDVDTRTYEGEDWDYVKGGLQTIDREFGYGVDQVTHHITDCHVAHHLFTDMPHYNLEKATEGVRGVLEPLGLYKRRDTRDFPLKVFQLHDTVGHCVENPRPRATLDEVKGELGLE